MAVIYSIRVTTLKNFYLFAKYPKKIVSKMALNVSLFISHQQYAYRIYMANKLDICWWYKSFIKRSYRINTLYTINFKWNWNFNEFLLINKQIKFKLDNRSFIWYTLLSGILPSFFFLNKKSICMLLLFSIVYDMRAEKQYKNVWRPKQTKSTQSRQYILYVYTTILSLYLFVFVFLFGTACRQLCNDSLWHIVLHCTLQSNWFCKMFSFEDEMWHPVTYQCLILYRIKFVEYLSAAQLLTNVQNILNLFINIHFT